MKFQKYKQQSWLTLFSVGLVGTLALSGCDRKDKAETEVAAPKTETEVVSVPAADCDDPLVQDRLKLALNAALNQKSKSFVNAYANQAEIGVDASELNGQLGNVLIDIQNPSVLQATNSNGMTTCQASVSMTLPSQDLYQANQVYASAGRPSLQERLAEQNISLNNNMLADDAFSYVVGQQDGQVRTRIVGEPAIIELVADVMAGSLVQNAIVTRRAEITAQETRRQQERRAAQQERRREQTDTQIRQPAVVKPAAPAAPSKPATTKPAATVSNPKPTAAPKTSESVAATNTVPTEPTAPLKDSKKLTPPTDKTIDMVIIEEEGTY